LPKRVASLPPDLSPEFIATSENWGAFLASLFLRWAALRLYQLLKLVEFLRVSSYKQR